MGSQGKEGVSLVVFSIVIPAFNEENYLKDKIILEVGCGSGRFTQYLSKIAKLLVVNDMSDAIFFNQYLSKKMK